MYLKSCSKISMTQEFWSNSNTKPFQMMKYKNEYGGWENTIDIWVVIKINTKHSKNPFVGEYVFLAHINGEEIQENIK